ncbi:MAG: acyltransferase [Comamonadaceae bacterium PBBC1]|nr:MAG: acyltransferase [Comamonadaceae bacterium PBBC1]
MLYRKEIDGLRAIAVLPVILFHAGFEAFSGGFVGVDVFFVISGYLITSIILVEYEQEKFSLINFYERRARRILPALFIVIIVCIPFAWFWLLPSDMRDFSQSLIAVSFFASNILFWRESGYFETSAELKPLLHTWSLAVEEQYYVFFPIFIMIFWRLGRKWIIIAIGLLFVVSIVFSEWAVSAKPAAAFYLLPMRAWEMLIGALAAFYLSQCNHKLIGKRLSEIGGWIGLSLILCAIVVFNKSTPFPGFYALVPTIGAVLIILFSSENTSVGKFLGNRVFVAVGLISYSAYLWHQPLFAFARHRTLIEPSYIVFSGLIFLTFILAYISWKFVETPFRSKLIFQRSAIFGLALLITLIISIFGYYGHQTNGFQGRIDGLVLDNAPDMKIYEKQVEKCWNSVEKNPNVDSACVLGADNAPVAFGLLGDSHAGSLLHVLNEEALKLNIQGKNYSYRSCPPLINAKPITQESGDIACYDLRKDFFRVAKSTPAELPDVLIVSARWAFLLEEKPFNNGEGGVESGNSWLWELPRKSANYADNMSFEIVESINSILKSGKIVVLIYPVPEMGWDVSRVLSKHWLFSNTPSSTMGSVSYDLYLERNKVAIDVLDSIEGGKNIIRVRPDKILCDTFVKERCAAHINGEALYYDSNHLSNLGAKIIIDNVLSTVNKNQLH